MGAILLLVASLAYGIGEEERFEVRNLGTCGLVTRYASSQIKPECLTQADNVYLDEDAGIVRRKGYAKYSATAITDEQSVRGVWPFRATDGTEYIVALSSETMFQSDGDGSFSEISPRINDISATQDMDCAQCLGKLWCVNGSDTMFWWDGTSTDTVSGAPTCSAIDCFRNRVVLGNCSGTLSQLRMSGELDGTDYTIPSSPVSTSPAVISLGGVNDGKRLQCIMGVYQDVLVLGKEDSTWGLYGFDRRDFGAREISREVGCIENMSAREKQGSLYWLSKRGIEKMTGPSIDRVSDPIRDLVDTIIVAGGNTRSDTDTSQSDFEAGNLTASGPGAPMSATRVAGALAPTQSSMTVIFTSGTLTNISTNSSTGNLALNIATNTYAVAASSWNCTTTSGAYCFVPFASDSPFTSLTCSGAGLASPCLGIFVQGSDGSATLNIFDSDGNTLLSQGVATGNNTEVYIGNLSASLIKISFKVTGNVTLVAGATTAVNVPLGFYLVMNLNSATMTGDDGTTYRRLLAHSIRISSYVPSGTFTSATFDTMLSTPFISAVSVNMSTSAGSPITFEEQDSADGSSWGTEVSYTPGNAPTLKRRYWRLIGNFSTTYGTSTPRIVEITTLTATTTGYFISQCVNPGSAITGWGLFQCNTTPNNGSISFAVSTGTSCNQVTRSTANWVSQTNNTVISIATASHVAYRTLFTLDSATQTPTLNDCTINWNEGTSRPSVAAEVYRDRYYLAYTSGTSGTVVNDSLLVLDSRDQWVLHSAPDCSSLGIYNRKLYCGDSANSGFVYQMDVGQDDNGSSFTSAIKTKDFDFGNTFQKKNLSRIYYDLAGLPDQSYSISLTPSYTLDASTDTFTLEPIGLNEDYSRFIAAKVPALLTNNTSGRWFSFGLSHSGVQGPWKLFGLRVVFTRLSED